MQLSLLNGKPTDLSLQHRGLAYGDGVFETLKVEQCKIEFLAQHMARLERGAKALGLEWSEQQHQDLLNQLLGHTEELNSLHVAKVMLLRNSAGRGYDFDPGQQQVDVILQIQPYVATNWSVEGVDVVVAKTPISENAVLAGHKHLNRLDSVLARQDARQAAVQEAIMLDQQGHMIEGSMSNLFVRLNDHWQTAPLGKAGVNGILRSLLLAYRPEISERHVHHSELASIQSAFITNSLIGVVPVRRINQHAMTIHSDIAAYQQEIQQLC